MQQPASSTHVQTKQYKLHNKQRYSWPTHKYVKKNVQAVSIPWGIGSTDVLQFFSIHYSQHCRHVCICVCMQECIQECMHADTSAHTHSRDQAAWPHTWMLPSSMCTMPACGDSVRGSRMPRQVPVPNYQQYQRLNHQYTLHSFNTARQSNIIIICQKTQVSNTHYATTS